MTIRGKLMEIQTKLNAPKNRKNSFGNYNYRSCEDILEALKPLLKEQECALTITDTPVMIGERVYIKATATLMDCKSADMVTAEAYAREADGKKGMDEAQVTGACSSYARKYALNGLFCIDDNKDFDTDENHNERENKKTIEEVGAKKIGTTKAKAFMAECKDKGIDVFKFMSNNKIEKLEDMTEEMFSGIHNHWDDFTKRYGKEQ